MRAAITRRMNRLVLVLLAACTSATSGNDAACDPELGTCGDGCQSPDTDGDGWSDEVEIAMETSATDTGDNPTARGELVFVMPYAAEPRPSSQYIESAAKLARADVAFGAAGFGDFPQYDGGNSEHDVPFYLVHRMMTADTPAGLASITQSFRYMNIIGNGIGNWFAIMRGGDDPEQHWEALRQTATGIGIRYPDPFDATIMRSTSAFSAAAAYPTTPPAGEEVGTIGGLGFRSDSTPIIIQITDTSAHDGGDPRTTPVSATRAVALASLRAINARVVGIMAWSNTGEDDLTAITVDTGGQVAPEAWGAGAARPANCPLGKCCVVAEDQYPPPQPDPINGLCPLVFMADRYSRNLSQMVIQAVAAIANGARFRIAAELRDDPTDDVDTTAFVDHVDAIASGACAGATSDGNTFTAIVAGAPVCFRITPKPNTVVDAGGAPARYRALLQLTGDGVASFAAREVFFVVPSRACTPPVLL